MRPLPRLASATALILTPALGACSSASTPTTIADSGSPKSVTDGGTPAHAPPCSGDASGCLVGTAHTDRFTLPSTHLMATLYRAFPSGNTSHGNQVTAATQIVAADNTWTFSGLDPWEHYYVQVEPGFPSDAGVNKTVATRVGPIVVPVSAGASVDVHVKPVQLDVIEQGSADGGMQLQTASAHLFEPTTGNEIGPGASVSILVGTTPIPMPYAASKSAYSVAFASPTPAQPTYQITTSLADGSAPTMWMLVADPPTFASAITSPPAGATVPAGQDLTVTWPVQPAADYVIVELFALKSGFWSSVYTSPVPLAADVTHDTVPGGAVVADAGPGLGPSCCLVSPGTYLLNVAFTKANCPPTADGCVHAGIVANEQITVQ